MGRVLDGEPYQFPRQREARASPFREGPWRITTRCGGARQAPIALWCWSAIAAQGVGHALPVAEATVRPTELVVGNCYFSVGYADQDLAVPLIQTLLYVGPEEDPEKGRQMWTFREASCPGHARCVFR